MSPPTGVAVAVTVGSTSPWWTRRACRPTSPDLPMQLSRGAISVRSGAAEPCRGANAGEE
jgi:hypothetical protein